MTSIARGHHIITKHFPAFYPSIFEEFERITGLSIEDYYVCLCTMASHYVRTAADPLVGGAKKSGVFRLEEMRSSSPSMADVFTKFITLEASGMDEMKVALWGVDASKPDEYVSDCGLTPLLRHPILKADDGRMIITDPVLFSEKAAVGPLFHLLDGGANANPVFEAFGHAVEAYVHEILGTIYAEPGGGLVNRLTCDVKGTDNAGNEIQISDACLDDAIELVLFEVKAVWLKDSIVREPDYERFLDHFRERYGKAVRQLASAIAGANGGAWSSPYIDLSLTERIVPVLVVHDQLLDAPMFPGVLAAEFEEELAPDRSEPDRDMVKGRFRVPRLIVMTLFDLEHLENSLRFKYALRDLLKDYSRDCPDRHTSMNNYLCLKSDRYPIFHNSRMAGLVTELIGKAMVKVFPEVGH